MAGAARGAAGARARLARRGMLVLVGRRHAAYQQGRQEARALLRRGGVCARGIRGARAACGAGERGAAARVWHGAERSQALQDQACAHLDEDQQPPPVATEPRRDGRHVGVGPGALGRRAGRAARRGPSDAARPHDPGAARPTRRVSHSSPPPHPPSRRLGSPRLRRTRRATTTSRCWTRSPR